jgi:uncharacterized protein DUF1566
MLKKLIQLIILTIISGYSLACATTFIDNLNGTTTDEDTSLIWQQEDYGIQGDWEEAISYCEGLDFAGGQDWRLPNIKELRSITDSTLFSPALDQAFFTNTYWDYWSSTTNANAVTSAWKINFVYGGISGYTKTIDLGVRCVRGGQ